MTQSPKNNQTETSLVKHKAHELKINFPKNQELKENEVQPINNAIQAGGIVDQDNKTYINKKKVPTILATDKKGANKLYNNLENDDKLEDNNEYYIGTPALQKEIHKRIEEPRSQLQREKLKHSRNALNAFTDTHQLETQRSLGADRIQKELPNMTKRKIKEENITRDQLTGKEFDNGAVGHHIERKADNPQKALDPNNIVVVDKKIHNAIHAHDAESKSKLLELINNNGWDSSIFEDNEDSPKF